MLKLSRIRLPQENAVYSITKEPVGVEKLRISKFIPAIIAIALAWLLILSVSIIFLNSASGTVDVSSAPATTDYSDLLQYECPQIHSGSAYTRFSAEPVPEAPDILLKTSVEGIQSYVVTFNGKVFVTTTTDVIAIDKVTGNIIWNTTLPAPQQWSALYKIDDTHLVIGNSCLDIETGRILWVSENFSAKVVYGVEGIYSPEEKVFYTQGDSAVQAWNFSNPSEPPTLIWEVPGTGIYTPTPSQSISPPPTPTPFDEQQVAGIPMIYVYVIVILVLVAVIAAAAYVYRKRTKN